jgi:uncharacterized OB-fold protein
VARFAYSPPPLTTDPNADEYTAPFWEATRREELTAPRCTNCGTFRMPPYRFCAHCQHQDLDWIPLPGTGRVYSFTVVRHALRPELADFVPYVPALIEPDGAVGMRFVSNVVDCEPERVAIDMAVKVAWEHISPQLVFPRWAPM